MKNRFLYIAFTSFMILMTLGGPVSGQSASSDEEAILMILEERDEQIKEILGPEGTEISSEQREELKLIINDVMNFEPMVQYALGDTWSTISEAQRQEFLGYFRSIVQEHSLSNLDIYRADVSYQLVDVNGDSATVQTMATYDDVQVPVVYELERLDGEWMITDFTADEVSTAEGYRTTFQSRLRQNGYEALKNVLKRRAEEISGQ